VSNRLIKDFARCLEEKLSSTMAVVEPETPGDAAGAPGAEGAPESATLAGSASSPGADVPGRAAGSPAAEPPLNSTQQVVPAASVSTDVVAPTPGAPPPAPPASQTGSSTSQGAELHVARLVADITRARIAAGLRFLASVIEPK
jgi:hypothetical protein